MTTEQIERMAREAGMRAYERESPGVDGAEGSWDAVTRFAALVAAAERERCAKVCEDMVLYTGFDCAAAIRAGG